LDRLRDDDHDLAVAVRDRALDPAAVLEDDHVRGGGARESRHEQGRESEATHGRIICGRNRNRRVPRRNSWRAVPRLTRRTRVCLCGRREVGVDRRRRAPRRKTARTETPLLTIARGLTAVLVEPDAAKRDRLRRALESRGFAVLATESSAAAS